ncbi:hypothetical protein MMC25_000063 [Agyrium rufum]|nr:hypothetical protein [Agyrium rufum]
MVAVGHLVGYGFGTLDLQVLLGPVFGDTQFKKLTVIAALVLLFAVGVTSWAVEERVLLASSDSENARVNPTAMLSKLFRTAFHLPPRIQAICWVQFWAWIGWFPFLFYSPTWVGEIYFRYSAPPGTSPSETDHLGEMGRIASLSLVVFSIITFLGSLLFPMLIRSPTEAGKPAFTPRPHPLLAPYMETLSKIQPDLLMAWLCSHLIFAAAMLMAPFVQSIHAATMLVGASGLPWALACWAPFAFMGIEINKLSSSLPSSRNHTPAPKIELSTPTSGTPQPIPPVSKFDDEKPTAGPGNAESSGEMAGIYLGMLNVFSTLPQFVGTFISMVVFSLLEPGKEVEESTKDVTDAADAGAAGGEGLAKSQLHKATAQTEGVNAIAICLFIGGLSSLVAAWATVKLRAVK